MHKKPEDNTMALKADDPRYKLIFDTVWKYVGDDDLLKQIHHPFSTNKNESLNKKMTVFAPKNKCFCTT